MILASFVVAIISANGQYKLYAQQLSALSGSFVDIGAGSRSASLGNAFVGLADDPSSLFTNPAGMSFFGTPSVMAMTTNQFGLVNSHYFSAIYPLSSSKKMSVGLGAISSGDDLMQETTFQAAYSFMLIDKLSLGAAVKARFTSFGNNKMNGSDYEGLFTQTEIYTGLLNQVHGNGKGFAIDFGVLYEPNDKIRFGVSLRDPIAPFNWQSEVRNPEGSSRGDYNEGLPMALHAGGSYRVNKNFLVTSEYQPALESSQDAALRGGIESTILDIISIRAGTEQWANNEDDEKYMLGFGIKTPKISGYRIQVDYTYMINELVNSHRIGILINFPNLH